MNGSRVSPPLMTLAAIGVIAFVQFATSDLAMCGATTSRNTFPHARNIASLRAYAATGYISNPPYSSLGPEA